MAGGGPAALPCRTVPFASDLNAAAGENPHLPRAGEHQFEIQPLTEVPPSCPLPPGQVFHPELCAADRPPELPRAAQSYPELPRGTHSHPQLVGAPQGSPVPLDVLGVHGLSVNRSSRSSRFSTASGQSFVSVRSSISSFVDDLSSVTSMDVVAPGDAPERTHVFY